MQITTKIPVVRTGIAGVITHRQVAVLTVLLALLLTNFTYFQMVHFDSQTIILAVIGMIGLFSTATVVSTAFRRNRMGNGKWQ